MALPDERLGEGTAGVWTRAQALAVLSPEAVRHRLRSRRWQVVRPGAYTDAGVTPSAPMRGWAAVLVAGGPGHAVAAGRTAARLLGLPLVDDDDPALDRTDHVHDDIVVGRMLRDTSTLHPRRLHLARSEVGTVSGLPTTSPVRTLVDLAGVLRHEALVCVLDAALHRRLVSADAVRQAVQDRAGCPGVRALRRALALADARAESPLETLGRLVLLPVAPGLVPQVRVVDEVGHVVARLDLGDRSCRLGIEGDGRKGHAGPAMAAKDHRRDALVQAQGWAVERYVWWDVRAAPVALQDRVRRRARQLAQR